MCNIGPSRYSFPWVCVRTARTLLWYAVPKCRCSWCVQGSQLMVSHNTVWCTWHSIAVFCKHNTFSKYYDVHVRFTILKELLDFDFQLRIRVDWKPIFIFVYSFFSFRVFSSGTSLMCITSVISRVVGLNYLSFNFLWWENHPLQPCDGH